MISLFLKFVHELFKNCSNTHVNLFNPPSTLKLLGITIRFLLKHDKNSIPYHESNHESPGLEEEEEEANALTKPFNPSIYCIHIKLN